MPIAMPFSSSVKARAWRRKYRQRPQVIAARKKEYLKGRNTPEKIARHRHVVNKWCASPTGIASRKRRYLQQRRDPLKVVIQRQRVKNWYLRNKKQVIAWNVVYRNNLNRTDPWWNIRNRLSSRIWHAIAASAGRKAFKTQELLGCSVAHCRCWLESLFTEGMSWAKFMAGEIHVDHVIPCVAFDLTTDAGQKACFHYTNLRPLWKADNLAKGSKILMSHAL